MATVIPTALPLPNRLTQRIVREIIIREIIEIYPDDNIKQPSIPTLKYNGETGQYEYPIKADKENS